MGLLGENSFWVVKAALSPLHDHRSPPVLGACRSDAPGCAHCLAPSHLMGERSQPWFHFCGRHSRRRGRAGRRAASPAGRSSCIGARSSAGATTEGCIGEPHSACGDGCARKRRPAKAYRASVVYTTLSPCAMGSGAIVLYGIPSIVAGEDRSFVGAAVKLMSRGIAVEAHQEEECVAILREFLRALPDHWNKGLVSRRRHPGVGPLDRVGGGGDVPVDVPREFRTSASGKLVSPGGISPSTFPWMPSSRSGRECLSRDGWPRRRPRSRSPEKFITESNVLYLSASGELGPESRPSIEQNASRASWGRSGRAPARSHAGRGAFRPGGWGDVLQPVPPRPARGPSE